MGSHAKMPPANAAAISQVIADIANIYPPLVTRSDQQSYLKKLTSTHKFTYYSATYGHTVHDAASLRKVLANTMLHHPSPEYGTAGGNAAVDMLFEHGCEMLEHGYVEEVRLAAAKEIVERREGVDDETSGEEEEEMALGDVVIGESSEHDEVFVPPGRRLRKREPPRPRKRKYSTSNVKEGAVSTEARWRDSKPGKLELKKARKIVGSATTSPSGQDIRVTDKLEAWRRSYVGERNDIERPQQREQECGRGGAETEAHRLQGYRQPLASAVCSQPLRPQPSSLDGKRHGGVGQSDNVRLREAVEELSRRVETAIVQLWDEIGDIA